MRKERLFRSFARTAAARVSAGILPILQAIALTAALQAACSLASQAHAEETAKRLFSGRTLPADMKPQSIGFYSKGCLAGGIALPMDGPTWQVMRLSRNRRWGHPDLIHLIEDLAIRARADGWNGLLIGDVSQPRGGPMLTGHLSHQVGLDADIWFSPMPEERLTYRQREERVAESVLKTGTVYVDDAKWTPAHAKLLKQAASYEQVQRILVHPGVKKKLCDTVKGDRAWLSKIRPYYGHDYHFHVRIKCPDGSPGCKPQAAVAGSDGCDKTLKWWFDYALKPKKDVKPKKPVKRREIVLSNLPEACRGVLSAQDTQADKAELPTRTPDFTAPALDVPEFSRLAVMSSKPIEAGAAPSLVIPVPTPRPSD